VQLLHLVTVLRAFPEGVVYEGLARAGGAKRCQGGGDSIERRPHILRVGRRVLRHVQGQLDLLHALEKSLLGLLVLDQAETGDRLFHHLLRITGIRVPHEESDFLVQRFVG
jgi:hypothetical protein